MQTALQAHETISQAAKESRPELRQIEKIKVGEAIRQGDVYLIRIQRKPEGFTAKTNNRQLAPGTTQGSRHVLAAGPTIYAKPKDADVLVGPVIVSKERFLLEHPEHAHFSLPAGTYQCRYQQEWSEVERRAVRD